MASIGNHHKTAQIDDTIGIEGAKRTVFSFPTTFDHSTIPLDPKRWPVAIIGSSMVGMSLGAALGYHGISSASFDRHPSTAIHPRAALFLLRTVEIFRQLGLDAIMTAESASNFDLDAGMLIVDKLIGGKVIMAMQESDPVEVARVSPVKRLWLTQNMFEPLLRKTAKDFGAETFFDTTVVHYEEQGDGVLVVVRDGETGQHRKFMADYLVASDGNRSATREREGIEWRGPGVLEQAISINFRADLAPLLGTRAVHGVTYIQNPKISAGFRLESGGQKGFQIVTRAGDKHGFAPGSVTNADARQYFHDATGIPEGEVELAVESISYWSAAGFVADRFQGEKGRVFIMGDAAHVMPPTGGMGGNTGIQDANNLAWKLAYVLSGKAGPGLLDTYSQERQPAAKLMMTQAFSRFQTRVERKKPDTPELPDIVCDIGYRYPAGAVLGGKGEDAQWEDPHSPLVVAGSRLPHVLLRDEAGKEVSSLDLVKQNLLLIGGEGAAEWVAAAKEAGMPMNAYVLSRESKPYSDPDGQVERTLKLQKGEALLVRPDAFIAWKAPVQVDGHARTLEHALHKILQIK